MKESPSQVLSITHEEINQLPLKSFEGKVVVVSDPEKLEHVIEELTGHKVYGFDTETRPAFVKGQRYQVSLIQLALEHKVFLIRIKHTGITESLLGFLQNEKIKKVGLALRDDLIALQRIKKFNPGGFTELSQLTKEAGYQVESAKKLTALLLGFRISKSAQTSNWEAQTLTEKQIQYAATDAWVCLEIYKRLVR
ncbi:MAG: 3'-5' exonuclease domain-containing protein 2 [Flammeovirgaceae bacterium]|nr:3'-5' exonuclease domain-containing protein 2 [Flammeovirgaceae bacterium]